MNNRWCLAISLDSSSSNGLPQRVPRQDHGNPNISYLKVYADCPGLDLETADAVTSSIHCKVLYVRYIVSSIQYTAFSM